MSYILSSPSSNVLTNFKESGLKTSYFKRYPVMRYPVIVYMQHSPMTMADDVCILGVFVTDRNLGYACGHTTDRNLGYACGHFCSLAHQQMGDIYLRTIYGPYTLTYYEFTVKSLLLYYVDGCYLSLIEITLVK